MTDHIHVYTMKGRCITSRLLTMAANPHSVERSETERLQWQLADLGRLLTHWNPVERVGLAKHGDETQIVRLKPVGTVRDMLHAGVTAALEHVRTGGVQVSYAGEIRKDGAKA